MSKEIHRSAAATKRKSGSIAPRAKDRLAVLVAAAMLVLATLAAYHNSLDGPFVLDDVGSILGNPTIHQLWPPGQALSPPTTGDTVSGRPILNLSLAVNYALSRTDARSYHMVNLAIHAMAVLVLFGVVRRTLLLESMSERFGPAATYLASAVAMLWAVHPLLTESVTYVSQRAESLMGLFYFLTLYCVIRASVSRPVWWSLAAVGACAMGMATKEVMVTAPVIVLLYDRTFLAGSFVGALRKRWRLHVALAACWGLLAYLMASVGNRGGTAGFGARQVVDWWSYAQMEFAAILHYLHLSVWPDSLCLDYGSFTTASRPLALSGAVVVGLLALGTVWGLLRDRKWGFLGAWFLVILAPTSSVVPLRDPVFEHRMYLSLAAVASAVVLGAFLLWRKMVQGKPWVHDQPVVAQWAAPCLVLVAAAVALGALTVARNNDYRSALAIWQDTVQKCPTNVRAQHNVGLTLCEEGVVPLGIEHLREAIRLDPKYYQAYSNLGAKLYNQDRFEEAAEQFRQGIRIVPKDVYLHVHLGMALLGSGKLDQAIEELHEAMRLDPRNAEAHESLGTALGRQGNYEAAAGEYREAVRINPQFAQAYQNLAVVLLKSGRDQEAAQARNQAAALQSAGGVPMKP